MTRSYWSRFSGIAPFLGHVADYELQRISDFAMIMSYFRDLIGGNSIALMISQPAKDTVQQRRNIEFNYSLLIQFTHLLGVNAIACHYRQRIAENQYLKDFFEGIIGDKYTKACAFYDANGDSYADLAGTLTKDTTDLDVLAIVVDIVNIASSAMRDAGAFVIYQLTMGTAMAIIQQKRREDWYDNTKLSPEQMLGYSTWRSTIDFSMLVSALGESTTKRYTDIYCTEEFWQATNPALPVYWTFLYSNILMTIQYDRMLSKLEGYTFEGTGQEDIDVPGGTLSSVKPMPTSKAKSLAEMDAQVGGGGAGTNTVYTTPKNFGGLPINGQVDGVSYNTEGQKTSPFSATSAAGSSSLLNQINDDPTPIAPGTTKNVGLWQRVVTVYVETADGKAVTKFNTEPDTQGFGGCDIDLEMVGGDETTANSMIITLWNLSESTKNKIIASTDEKKGVCLKVQAGYSDDYGTIFVGNVSSKYDKWVGGDVATILIAYDDIIKMNETEPKRLTYVAGDLYIKAIHDIIKISGVTVGYIENPRNLAFLPDNPSSGNNQVVLYNTPAALMNEMVQKINGNLDALDKDASGKVTHDESEDFIFYIRDGIANCCRKGMIPYDTISMGSENGLMEAAATSNTTNDEVATMKSLLQWRVKIGSRLVLKSRTNPGTFRIRGYKHIINGSQFYTEASLGAI